MFVSLFFFCETKIEARCFTWFHYSVHHIEYHYYTFADDTTIIAFNSKIIIYIQGN